MAIEPPRPGDVVRARDERWRVVRVAGHPTASIIEVVGCDRFNRGTRTRFVLPFEPVERIRGSIRPRIVRPRRWRYLARELLSGALPSYTALRGAARARISILPFQLEPALAVTQGLASRILIADEVGLGKTIQAGLIVSEIMARHDPAHALVVVPAALREQWRDELATRFDIGAAVADSTSLPLLASGGVNPWRAQPVVITSIDYIKRAEALRALETTVWDLVIFDEAHALASRSDRNTAAAAIAQRARVVLLLTATPHSGDDDEFARLCGIGDLDARFPLLAFRRTRGDVGLNQRRRTIWLPVRPTSAEARLHEALLRYARLVWQQRGSSSADARLAAMVLARRACSSAWSLARSLERRLLLLSDAPPHVQQLPLPLNTTVEDDDLGLELGTQGLDDVDDERRQLAALLDLARGAALHESKVRAIERFLRRTGEPAIVFTEYRDTLERLRSRLDCAVLLHGGMGAAERRDALDAFTSGRTRVLLATDAASEGLNLHHRCRLVINLELPWTPRRLEQRVGRVQRIGQQRTVHQVHLLARGTFEEHTLAVLSRRSRRAHEAVEGLRDVAESILGDVTPPRAPGPAATATPVRAADLRAAASEEAHRILTAGRLGSGAAASDTRPFACVLRTRQHRPTSVLAYRIEFDTADHELLWDTLLGVDVSTGADLIRIASHDLRRVEAALAGHLAPVVADAHAAAAANLRRQLRESLAVARVRELAIFESTERRGARLAAGPVQRALFDRRAERAAADRRAALDEALALSRDRLLRIERLQQAIAGACGPAFTLVRAR